MSKRSTIEDFIKRAREVHGDKYDYSRSVYRGCKTRLTIGCDVHGYFQQSPNTHVSSGCGCPECGKNVTKSTTESFILKAINKHGDRYDYSKVEYVNSRTKVTIICRKHGEFRQTADAHLRVGGCQICGQEQKFLTEAEVNKRCGNFGWNLCSGYKNCYTRTNFTCLKCGSVRKLLPSAVMQSGAQCLTCDSHGSFKDGTDGGVYVVKITLNTGEVVIGFGRTNDLSSRLRQHKKDLLKSGAKMEVLHKLVTNTKEESLELEAKLKTLWNKQELDVLASFRTEWTALSNLDKVLDILH